MITRHRVLMVAAAAFAVAWATVDRPLQGPTVVELTPSHGVHITDPLGLLPLAWMLGRSKSRTTP